MSRSAARSRWLLAAVLAALAIPAAASAGLRVKAIDTSEYPLVRVTALTPTAKSPAPTLRENSKVVHGLTVERLSAKNIVLAIDRSPSMKGEPIARATAAAQGFVDAKPPADQISVVTFGKYAVPLSAFSTATIDADASLRTLRVGGSSGTALYDAVVLGAGELASQPQPRLLILLTDGYDVGSGATLRQALAAARKAHVAVYPIAIHGRQYAPGPLKRLAGATGGTFFTADSTTQLKPVFLKIAGQLKRTWELRYFTTVPLGERTRLTVLIPQGSHATHYVTFGGPGAGELVKKSSVRRHWWFAIFVGLIAAALVYLLYQAFTRRREQKDLRRRLEPYTGDVTAATRSARRARGNAVGEPRERFAMFAPVFRVTEGAFHGLRFWRRLERMIVRADLPLQTAEFFYLMLLSGFLLLAIGVVAGSSALVLLLLFVLGVAVPNIVLSNKGKRRVRAFEAQLPDLLNALAASLKVGHSFRQALTSLVDDAEAPSSTEFRRVLAETRLGRSLDAALANMGERLGSKDLDFVLRAVVIQRQVGGSLAGLFEGVAETITQRQQFKARLKSLTAQGRMSAVILVLMPFVVVVLIKISNGSYLSPLWHTSTGHFLVVLGLVMITIGSLILRKMVDIKA